MIGSILMKSVSYMMLLTMEVRTNALDLSDFVTSFIIIMSILPFSVKSKTKA